MTKPDLNRFGNALNTVPEIMRTYDVDQMIREANAQIDDIISDLDRLDMADSETSVSESGHSNLHIDHTLNDDVSMNDGANELDTEFKTDCASIPQKQMVQIKVSMAESTVGISASISADPDLCLDALVDSNNLNTMSMIHDYIHHEPIDYHEEHSPLYMDGPPSIPMAFSKGIAVFSEKEIALKEDQILKEREKRKVNRIRTGKYHKV